MTEITLNHNEEINLHSLLITTSNILLFTIMGLVSCAAYSIIYIIKKTAIGAYISKTGAVYSGIIVIALLLTLGVIVFNCVRLHRYAKCIRENKYKAYTVEVTGVINFEHKVYFEYIDSKSQKSIVRVSRKMWRDFEKGNLKEIMIIDANKKHAYEVGYLAKI